MRSISDVTPDYLSQALGTLVGQIEIESIGEGYMADVFRLTLTGPAVPSTVILKLPSQDSERREEAEKFSSYGKESFFYRELSPLISLGMPKCFYNPADHFCLILEDVGNTHSVNPKTGIAFLSELHLCQFPDHNLPGFDQGFIAASDFLAQRSGDFFADWPDDPGRTIGLEYCQRSIELLPRFEAFPQVLSHMDFRPDNLSVREGQILAFDWGEFCLAPAGFDLASLFLNICSTEYRQEHENEMLNTYATQTGQPVEAVLDSYRLSLLPMIYLPMLMRDRHDFVQANELTSRLHAALCDHADFLATQL